MMPRNYFVLQEPVKEIRFKGAIWARIDKIEEKKHTRHHYSRVMTIQRNNTRRNLTNLVVVLLLHYLFR